MALFNRYNTVPETLADKEFALVRTKKGFVCFVGDQNNTPVPHDVVFDENQKPFVTRWNIATDGETLTLPPTATNINNNYEIDWGDGSEVENNGTSHTYSKAGTYHIKIKGILYDFTFPSSYTEGEKLIEIVSWGDIAYHIVRFKSAKNLSALPMNEVPPNFDNIRYADQMFYDNNLSEIPENLFERAVLCADFYEAFASNNLTIIPKKLFSNCRSAIKFFGTFRRNQITELPEELFWYCPKAEIFTVTFQDNNLTSIPKDLFKYNTEAKSFYYVFRSNALTVYPSGIHDHNNRSDTDHRAEFEGNDGMTGVADPIWLKEKTPTNMFQNLTKLSNYADIPLAWGGSYEGTYNIKWQHGNLYWDFENKRPLWWVNSQFKSIDNRFKRKRILGQEHIITSDDIGSYIELNDRYSILTISQDEDLAGHIIRIFHTGGTSFQGGVLIRSIGDMFIQTKCSAAFLNNGESPYRSRQFLGENGATIEIYFQQSNVAVLSGDLIQDHIPLKDRGDDEIRRLFLQNEAVNKEDTQVIE